MRHLRPWSGSPLASAVLAVGAILALARPADAETIGCLFENGAVVIPAILDRAGGDWLIDIAEPHTLLHETRAQMEGIDGDSTVGAFRFGGQRLDALPVAVANLDARAPGFVPPIVGVIGADVLGRYVVDLEFAPCRLTLWAPGKAPPLRGSALPLTLIDGRPTVPAAVSDGRRALAGPFVVDTASLAAVRMAMPNRDPADRGDPRQRAPTFIRALSVAQALFEKPSAARGAELPATVAGALGTGLLSRYRLRIDFAGGQVILAKP